MNEIITETQEDSFATDVLSSDLPVLVDFWAEWCGPCKAIAPLLDEIANDFRGKVNIVKVNVDNNASLPEKYGVRGIPTLLLFKNAEVVATSVGALTKAQLTEFLTPHCD